MDERHARKQRAARGADLHGGGDPYPCATRTPRRGNLHTLACDQSQETRTIERWSAESDYSASGAEACVCVVCVQ